MAGEKRETWRPSYQFHSPKKENPPTSQKLKKHISKKRGLSERSQGNQRLSTSSTSSFTSTASTAVEVELWQERYAKLKKRTEEYKRLLQSHKVPLPGGLEPISSVESNVSAASTASSSSSSSFASSASEGTVPKALLGSASDVAATTATKEVKKSEAVGTAASGGKEDSAATQEAAASKRQRVAAPSEVVLMSPSQQHTKRIALPTSAPSPVRRAAVAAAEAVLSQLHRFAPAAPAVASTEAAAASEASAPSSPRQDSSRVKELEEQVATLAAENSSLKEELQTCKDLIAHLESQKGEFRSALEDLYQEASEQREKLGSELHQARERIIELENNEASMLVVQRSLQHAEEESRRAAAAAAASAPVADPVAGENRRRSSSPHPSPVLSPDPFESPDPDMVSPAGATDDSPVATQSPVRRRRRSSMFLRSNSIPFPDIPATEEEQPPMKPSPNSPPLPRTMAGAASVPGTPFAVAGSSHLPFSMDDQRPVVKQPSSGSDSTVSYSSEEDSPSKEGLSAGGSTHKSSSSGAEVDPKILLALRFENDCHRLRIKEDQAKYEAEVRHRLQVETQLEESKKRQEELHTRVNEIQEQLRNSLTVSVKKIESLQQSLREEREQVASLQAELRRVSSARGTHQHQSHETTKSSTGSD